MSIAVLVPWRTNDPARVEIWSWVLKRWQLRYPTFEVITGTPAEGPWSKGAAVADALRQTKAGTLIVADADVWCDGVQAAVMAVEQNRAKWAMPHKVVKRLSQESTKAVLSGRTVLDRSTDLIENHTARRGGGLVVLSREVLEGVPMDPGFTRWGQEDDAWAIALQTPAGPARQGAIPPLPGSCGQSGADAQHHLRVLQAADGGLRHGELHVPQQEHRAGGQLPAQGSAPGVPPELGAGGRRHPRAGSGHGQVSGPAR